MRVLGHEKPAYVAQHHQDVLIHRVDMKQVVLHLPDDFSEHPQVTPQNRGLVHQAHGVGNALRLLQDAPEGVAVDGVTAKLAVHHPTGVVQGSQGTGRQTPDANGGLVEKKGLKNGVRFARIQIVAGNLKHAGLFRKPFVDGLRRSGCGKKTLFNIEKQYLVELRHCLGRPVIAAHQCFAGPNMAPTLGTSVSSLPPGGAVSPRGGPSAKRVFTVAERVGHSSLQVKHQSVFAATSDDVQTGAYQA